MTEPVVEKGIYRHYKGGLYEVVGTARHSETLELLVLYRHLGEEKDLVQDFWVRPYSLFTDTVTINGQEVPRFELSK